MGLKEYHRKRRFGKTPEPRGTRPPKSGSSFVVQKHAASRLHYDFRVELDGVLKSWAVPKGPSLFPSRKRLAVHVEDHPVDYGSFEGTIPKDEYGGGTVMVWDRGTWRPSGDPARSYEQGRLKFTLHGSRLKGGWSLVRMGGRADDNEKNWLLIKEKDAEALSGRRRDITDVHSTSVSTNRSMDEITGGTPEQDRADASTSSSSSTRKKQHSSSTRRMRNTPAPPVNKRSSRIPDPSALPSASASPQPRTFHPQLATLVKQAPAGEEWLHEIKFDGYRIITMIDNGRIVLHTRNGKDWTRKFSAIAGALADFPLRQGILDGEVVVLRRDGTSDFQALQNVLKGEASDPLVYYVFDLPHCGGYNLCQTPLRHRKELLAALFQHLPPGAARHLRYSDHIRGQGARSFEQACRHALEGIISKLATSPYRQTRSKQWVKVKCHHRQELVIGGYTDPAGSRKHFGALLLGFYDEQGRLHYAGRVGTGFSGQRLARIHALLTKRHLDRPAFVRLPSDRDLKKAHWVKPDLVAEVEFLEWTREGVLRHPAFIGLREDKSAKDIRRETPMVTDEGPAQPSRTSGRRATARTRASAEDAGMPLSHPDKVLYPQQGITKRDLADYYRRLAPWVLPHVAGRPLTLVRCPHGHQKTCFYQKHASGSLPESIRTIFIEEKGSKADHSYLVIDDVQGLIALVQMGVLEMHPWGCLEDRVDRPDRLVFDLDPGPGVKWDQVIEGAELLRRRLDEDGIVSYVKTSGGKGLHVVAPLVRRATWDELKQYTRRLAAETAERQPSSFVATMSKAKRKGKIFIDYLRNGFGSTSIATYGVRALSGAPVSTPVSWKELPSLSGPQAFTLTTLPDRMDALKKDPWEGFFQLRQSISRSALKA